MATNGNLWRASLCVCVLIHLLARLRVLLELFWFGEFVGWLVGWSVGRSVPMFARRAVAIFGLVTR